MFKQRSLAVALISFLAFLFHINADAQSADRFQTLKEITELKKRFNEKEKLFLSPSVEDQAAFGEFLKQPNTGLIRLLPRGLYNDKLIMRGGGAYYSFARLSYEDPFGYDIELEPAPTPSNEYVPPPTRGYLLRTGCGLISALGSVPLEKVTLEHKAIEFLETYAPPSTAAEFKAETWRLRFNIGKNGYGYNRVALVTPGFTYALRSINYGKSDVIVVFRVVRKEIDGSVVILWKQLKKFPAPARLR